MVGRGGGERERESERERERGGGRERERDDKRTNEWRIYFIPPNDYLHSPIIANAIKKKKEE